MTESRPVVTLEWVKGGGWAFQRVIRKFQTTMFIIQLQGEHHRWAHASKLIKRYPLNMYQQETQVCSLGREDPLEREMAIYSRVVLPGQPHGQRSLEGYSPWSHKELDRTEYACIHAISQSQRGCLIYGPCTANVDSEWQWLDEWL